MKKIFFFGDSNTYGYDPRDFFGGRYPESVRWTSRLNAALKGLCVLEADGMNGRCIPSTERERLALFREIKGFLPFDLFGIMLGTNDYLSRWEPDPDLVGGRMEDLLRELGLRFPSLPVLVVTPPVMDFRGDPVMAAFRTDDGSLSAVIREAVRASGHPGVTVLCTDDWGIEMGHDGVHLTPEGHRIFAEHMEQWIRNWIGMEPEP